MEAAGSLLEVGQVVRPHALAGEVIVDLVSNRLERLDAGSLLVGRGAGGSEAPLRVVSSRPHQHRYIVVFDGVCTLEQADALRGTVLLAGALADPEAMFVHELIGCELVEVSGLSHGPVVAVQANPASDLLVGEAGWLVPLRFVVERQPRRIVVDVPAGLFE
ncbi:MAG: ribosome maturation factor RimM [Acidimicrobiales bacterium]